MVTFKPFEKKISNIILNINHLLQNNFINMLYGKHKLYINIYYI